MAKIKWTPDTEIKENLERAKQMENLNLEYLMQRIEQLERALSQRMEKIEQSLKESKEVLKQH